MPDLQEVFRVSTQKVQPEHGALERQHRRQRRSGRNRRAGAFVLVAALMVGLVTVVLVSRPGAGGQPQTQPTSPVPINTSVPIGLQLVGTDGSPQRQFAAVPSGGSAFRLSPDGSTIAYYLGGEVATIGADGSGQRILTHEPNENVGDAQDTVSWSPDGTEIAYTSSGNIYVMNADGSQQRQLTSTQAGSGNYYPAWSPDGTTIAYWHGSDSGVDGGPADAEIYTIRATGGTPSRLTHDDTSSIEPTWSPDGAQIAYWSGGELWAMGRDGNDQHLVYRGKGGTPAAHGGTWAPAWSPDGTKIAFLCYVENPTGRFPLLDVRFVDVASREVTSLHMRVGTDLNGPQWVTNGTLLVNRYD